MTSKYGASISSGIRGGGFESIESFSNGPMNLNRDIVKIYPTTIYAGGEAGTQVAPPTPNYSTPVATPSKLATMAKGTTAIARTSPTAPNWMASQALGEVIKDGIPSLIGVQTWKELTDRARKRDLVGSTSGEYLNYQFGWKPLLNDVLGFAKTVKSHNKILRDFRSRSGKVSHVRYTFPTESYSGSNPGSVSMARHDLTVSFNSGGLHLMQSQSETWFEGEFTFHLPVGDSVAAKMQRYESYANHLLGVRLTPQLLWELAPWSWALDWFGNAGDVIANVSMLHHDGLVLSSGFVMCHTRHESRVTNTQGYSGICPGGAYTSRLRETKTRYPANPYFGFGAVGALNATQSAILIALGLNRVSRQ